MRAAEAGPAAAAAATGPEPRLALLPWGDLIEDFLDEIGVSLEDFSAKMTGGWLFGYVEALQLEGIQTSIFCFSARVTTTTRSIHAPTGAEVVVIPASRAYRWLRRRMIDPYGASAEKMFGPTAGVTRHAARAVRHVAPYMTTAVGSLCREIRRSGCGAILCQEYESARFDACVIAGRLLRIPVFATFQGGNWQRSAIERFVRPLTVRRCAGLIIGPSGEAARVAAQYSVPPWKVCRTFNALDLSIWQPRSRQDARRTLGIGESTRVAIWHGRIDIHRKGLDVLLEAWRSICSSRPQRDLLLLLVGSGAEAGALDEAIARTGVTRLRRNGEYLLDQASTCRHLNAADVYVFPSRHEGFPVAPLEAMACGLPVVAASASGVADIIDAGEASGGVVVPTGDAVLLGLELGRLLDDEELARRLGGYARTRVEQAFSPSTVGNQLHAFFRARGGFGAARPVAARRP